MSQELHARWPTELKLAAGLIQEPIGPHAYQYEAKWREKALHARVVIVVVECTR